MTADLLLEVIALSLSAASGVAVGYSWGWRRASRRPDCTCGDVHQQIAALRDDVARVESWIEGLAAADLPTGEQRH